MSKVLVNMNIENVNEYEQQMIAKPGENEWNNSRWFQPDDRELVLIANLDKNVTTHSQL